MSDAFELKGKPDCKTCLGNGFVAYVEIPGVRPIRTAPCPDCFPMPDATQPNPPDPETIAAVVVKWLKSQLQEGPARLSSLMKSNCYADAYAAQVTFLTIETIVESLESGDWRKEIEE